MCSMSRDPRWEEYTICTAAAPEAVFTVREYGDVRPTLRARISAQLQRSRTANPQVSDPQKRSRPKHGIRTRLKLASPLEP